jgi:cyclopropane-fatty-acyl-phospholipid synthase
VTVISAPPHIATDRWPDVATVPVNRLNASVAAALIRRVARRLPLRVELPDGTPLVRASTGPVLRLVRPDAVYQRLGVAGLVGFGEAYQAGDWEAEDLTGVLSVFAGAADRIVPRPLQWLRHVHGARHPRSETNTLDGSRRNIHRHYDLSNELFALFLDPSMTYSSALFGRPSPSAPDLQWSSLEPAQHAKIDRLLDRIGVRDGTRLLEVGTGWGALAIRAAQRGARVHSVTISQEQLALARQRVADAGVADRVEVELRDYRQIPAGSGYDAIASVEMIEAVGERFWPDYFRTLDRLLTDRGRIGIQAITMRHERMLATRHSYTWMHKYIFPGGLIPSVRAISQTLAAHTRLRLTDEFAFGQHYAATLRLWRQRFASQAARVETLGFDDVFRRTWNFYLAYSEAGFRSGYLDVHQLILERP